jgi:hypothetical protein
VQRSLSSGYRFLSVASDLQPIARFQLDHVAVFLL